MSKIFIFLVLTIFSIAATALSTDTVNIKELKCSKNGTAIIYVNGVRVPGPKALLDLAKISKLLDNKLIDKPKKADPLLPPYVEYDNSYNTNKSDILDFIEAGAQKLMLEKGLSRDRAWFVVYTALSEGELTAVPYSTWGITTEDIEASTLPSLEELMRLEVSDTNLLKKKFNDYLASDSKVIMISHSQGNLFTNIAFRDLELENPGNTLNDKHFLDYSGLFRNLQIATPTNQVHMPGDYITNNYDFIRLVPGASSGNASFTFPLFNDPRGTYSLERLINHSLIDTYLQTHPNFKQLRDRVLQGIVDQASKLESNCGKPPVAIFTYKKSPTNPMKYTFDASDSTDPDVQDPNDPTPVSEPPDFDILTFDWYVDGLKVMSGVKPQFTFAFEGEHSVKLVVTDREENVNEEESMQNINVVNYAPIANFISEVEGLKATFNSSESYDPDGTITAFYWDFGDGLFSSGRSPAHTYLLPGTYTVTLTVTDNNGKAGTFTNQVEVIGAEVGCLKDGKSFPGKKHINPYGSMGGFVADTANVAPTVTLVGGEICETSQVSGSVMMYSGKITGASVISGSIQIFESTINDSNITTTIGSILHNVIMTDSTINAGGFSIIEGELSAVVANIQDMSVEGSIVKNSSLSGSLSIIETEIYDSALSDLSLSESLIQDATIVGSSVHESLVESSTVTNSSIFISSIGKAIASRKSSFIYSYRLRQLNRPKELDNWQKWQLLPTQNIVLKYFWKFLPCYIFHPELCDNVP